MRNVCAISYPKKEEKDNLSREERNAIQTLEENIGIVIQRPDKGGGVVILNSENYKAKMQHLLN